MSDLQLPQGLSAERLATIKKELNWPLIPPGGWREDARELLAEVERLQKMVLAFELRLRLGGK